jgi:hypothetical protein
MLLALGGGLLVHRRDWSYIPCKSSFRAREYVHRQFNGHYLPRRTSEVKVSRIGYKLVVSPCVLL